MKRHRYDTRRWVDVVGAGVILVLTAPIQALVALLVRIALGKPVLFRQIRAGKDERPFELIKFRTMRPVDGSRRDEAQRMTRLGTFLRASSLDELPTMVNVLRGEMSLVGPRPLLMKYLPRYTPLQRRRHEVRPGVTGLAQVSGRNAITWGERLALDVWYVDNRGPLLDLRILVRTVGKVVLRRGITESGEATMSEFRGSSGRG